MFKDTEIREIASEERVQTLKTIKKTKCSNRSTHPIRRTNGASSRQPKSVLFKKNMKDPKAQSPYCRKSTLKV